uniref:Small nuclear ribonucleoprotein Sm D3 n=2 Tax=Euteleostomi TaxID=117571 RepID=A0A8C3AHJ2_CYCLU
MSIGVPIKVLHEAEGHIVTCETNTGEVYRGKLIEAEDNMNCQMSNITVTYRDGRVAQLEQVYIRGSKIRFLILPDMLKNAPMLKSMKNKNQGSGAGRGKAAILKAQGKQKGFGTISPKSLCSYSTCDTIIVLQIFYLSYMHVIFFNYFVDHLYGKISELRHFGIMCPIPFCLSTVAARGRGRGGMGRGNIFQKRR